jgi:glutamate-ammonia-ligase adenylyltransferase
MCATPILPTSASRLHKLTSFSSLYENFLRRFPQDVEWLSSDAVNERPWHVSELIRDAKEITGPAQSVDDWFQLLRRFRRRHSMRLTYRTLNGLAHSPEVLEELTHLGEVVLRMSLDKIIPIWEERFGSPWIEQENRRCELAILGLGKFGGRELNFCSDLDLILVMEEDGFCRKHDRETHTTNGEFYTRACRDLMARLQENTDEGFLYHIDLRLRPEGEMGPLVRTQSAMENYYFTAGQTWERLAMIRGRVVAGDLALGEDLMENLQSFRYPRHPPPSILREVAALKTRTEKELLGQENVERNLKTGYGGIREIEFLVQALQLLHAGKFPFLQTHSVANALSRMERYEILPREDCRFLHKAYFFFRQVENLIQMRGEQQTHLLPVTPGWEETFADACQLPTETFVAQLAEYRKRVRTLYHEFFQLESNHLDSETDWWMFFTGNSPTPQIEAKLNKWFPSESEREDRLRVFLSGGPNRPMYRELLHIFLELEPHLDQFLPQLAFPLRALGKISDFAEHYGARRHFFNTCTTQPRLVEMLGLLFDRSRFLYSILSGHPEILEELLVTDSLRKTKSVADHLREMEHFPRPEDRLDWLWLYVKAEQVRLSIAQLLGIKSIPESEEQLSRLATATTLSVLQHAAFPQPIGVIGLGKLGGHELSLGSDLDMMFVSAGPANEECMLQLRQVLKGLSHSRESFSLYDIDLRLRPHGNDGPQIVSIESLRSYYQGANAIAQPWEFLMLTRSRWIGGDEQLRSQFEAFKEQVLYDSPPSPKAVTDIQHIRQRLLKEKFHGSPPELAYKTGPGGLVDVEFSVQLLSWKLGKQYPQLRIPSTRQLLKLLQQISIPEYPPIDFVLLEENYSFLKEVEWNLRRDQHEACTVIPEDASHRFALARWLGFADFDSFFKEYRHRMEEIRLQTSPILT